MLEPWGRQLVYGWCGFLMGGLLGAIGGATEVMCALGLAFGGFAFMLANVINEQESRRLEESRSQARQAK